MDKRTDPTMPSTSSTKSTETKPRVLDAKGAVGKQFTGEWEELNTVESIS